MKERKMSLFMNYTPTPPAPNRRKSHRTSVVVSMIIILLILVNLSVIYAFSSANREESGEMSAGVTRVLLENFYSRYDDLSPAEQEAVLQSTHKFVRKAAHFCEFALLGFLSAGLLLWLSDRVRSMNRWKTWLYPAAFTLLYAISDEIHQIFTNRGPRVTDVLIDVSGAVFGILVMQGLAWLVARCRAGRHTPPEMEGGEGM